MQKQILGFITVSRLVNNVPEAISPLGELTTWSRTYSKSKGEYTTPSIPGMLLTTFSVSDPSGNTQYELNTGESQLILRIANACLDYAATHMAPLDPIDFRAAIQAEFIDEIQSVQFGDLISGANTTLPAWFSFQTKEGDQNNNRIWFSDEDFKIDYPEYDITVISPLENVNNFLLPWADAVALLNARNMSMLVDEVQIKKELHPETYLRYYEFDFVNRTNPTQKQKCSWWILVYGVAGDYDEAIKEKIVELLVKTTGEDEETWKEIFPDLFKRTEFMIWPMWMNHSIPNMSTLTGLYSSFTNMKEALDYVVPKAQFYTEDWVRNNAMVWPVTYKALSVVSVDGQHNMTGQEHLRDLYKDYIPIPSTDPDFERMSLNTQNWVHFLIRLISLSETATSSSTLPAGFRRIKRDGLWYISSNFNQGNFMVCQRNNFLF